MYGLKEVSKVYHTSKKVDFDDNSRFVIMSDVHRGDGSWADDFHRNQNLFFSALFYYYEHEFTYIENGDGDELWKFRSLKDIIRIHSDVFWLMSKYYEDGRLYFIYGNHDMVKNKRDYIAKNMYYFLRERDKKIIKLFKDIELHEGLILKHCDKNYEIFLTHGHQVDIMSSALWKLSRFLVRYLWRPIDNLGFNDPTSTAKNYTKKENVERSLTKWVEENKCMLITGHTHRSMLPEVGQLPYINDGSCVHPRCITAIEILKSEIMLVKWSVKSRPDGTLYIGRELLAGPFKIEDYYKVFERIQSSIDTL
ncbi:UDP-2,3-diacylglucosamine pyrophosphatase LpxH [Alkalibaculum bacchi]|uniref:UDP-2,3-diacylglucosamine pyrophosphatase LpxH n=1 Tax=Alkalibaculum bacchi TaxID=645887 RepID=A0A366IBM4_9FIRM|nr:metallophosphoesterase [Alkalibaculum bacchi]RBP66669.1 UDP-2,3-diacylglucosamine pyrophosphatase LpxH [Alkalibaculum bacchi]